MKKTALVLAGGGSRGAYQIGVWQALKELDVKIDVMTGTSIGALNSALVIMDNLDHTMTFWKSLETSMLLDIKLDENQSVKQKNKAVIKQFIIDYMKQGGTDAYPLKKIINEYVDEDTIRNSSIEFGIVVVDKSSLQPLELFKEQIKEGQLSDYLVASCSLFPALKSCQIEGTDYVDGGYYDNIPVELAIKKDAQRIIAVDLEAIGFVRKHTFDMADDLTFIRCYWDLGPIMLFDYKTICKNIQLGYLDAMKTFGVYDGIAFAFIKGEIKSKMRAMKQQIQTLNETIALTFSKHSQTKKETVFHLNMATHIKRKYDVQLTNRFPVFFQVCMESAGEIFEVDPTKLYSVDTFNERLLEQMNEIEITIQTEKTASLQNRFQSILNLIDKKVRTVSLAVLLKKAIQEGEKIDLTFFSMFLSEEFMGAYYLALLESVSTEQKCK